MSFIRFILKEYTQEQSFLKMTMKPNDHEATATYIITMTTILFAVLWLVNLLFNI